MSPNNGAVLWKRHQAAIWQGSDLEVSRVQGFADRRARAHFLCHGEKVRAPAIESIVLCFLITRLFILADDHFLFIPFAVPFERQPSRGGGVTHLDLMSSQIWTDRPSPSGQTNQRPIKKKKTKRGMARRHVAAPKATAACSSSWRGKRSVVPLLMGSDLITHSNGTSSRRRLGLHREPPTLR